MHPDNESKLPLHQSPPPPPHASRAAITARTWPLPGFRGYRTFAHRDYLYYPCCKTRARADTGQARETDRTEWPSDSVTREGEVTERKDDDDDEKRTHARRQRPCLWFRRGSEERREVIQSPLQHKDEEDDDDECVRGEKTNIIVPQATSKRNRERTGRARGGKSVHHENE